jgi:hypothetical protein
MALRNGETVYTAMVQDPPNQDTVRAEFPDVGRVTFNESIYVAWPTAYEKRSIRFPSLAGASLHIEVPDGHTVHNISASALFERRDMRAGFQRHPRGSSLIQLLPDIDRVSADSLVSTGGGLLAHYSLDWGPTAVAGFTLWQGPWSDVFTFDYVTFEEALDAFSRFAPRDTEAGAVLDPPAGWSLQRDNATVDCGDIAVELEARTEATAPQWPGLQAGDVELFHQADGSDDRISDVPSVLAVSRSAVASVSWVPRPGRSPKNDAEVVEFARGLRLAWTDVSPDASTMPMQAWG